MLSSGHLSFRNVVRAWRRWVTVNAVQFYVKMTDIPPLNTLCAVILWDKIFEHSSVLFQISIFLTTTQIWLLKRRPWVLVSCVYVTRLDYDNLLGSPVLHLRHNRWNELYKDRFGLSIMQFSLHKACVHNMKGSSSTYSWGGHQRDPSCHHGIHSLCKEVFYF